MSTLIPWLVLSTQLSFAQEASADQPEPDVGSDGTELVAPVSEEEPKPTATLAEEPEPAKTKATLREEPAPEVEAPMVAPVAAVEPAVPAAVPEAKGPPKTEFKVGGLYTAWGLYQNNFLLGLEHPLDDAAYTVQMLRFNVEARRGNVGAIARIDAGQGWWGTDNNPNTRDITTLDADGLPVETDVYNEDKLFGSKDTNYAVHVDWAYGFIELPAGDNTLTFNVGRHYFGVGHKLVLDQDLDGISANLDLGGKGAIKASWAKMSEGLNSVQYPKGLLMSDDEEYRDADLVGLQLFGGAKKSAHTQELFALYYAERTAADWSLLPQGLGYTRARHVPNVSNVLATGVSVDGHFGKVKDKSVGTKYAAEVDVLVGSDKVDNADHAGGTLDVNNGKLFGYNAYLRVDQLLDVASGMEVGALFGYGSGDADRTGGAGNINKIQTMGFFPLTNVWEDSVMPDVAGISPQGLGSPVSRGYREFENTMAIQGRMGITPIKKLKLDASYTFLRSATPIQGFDATGTPTGPSSSDLGMEVDANVAFTVTNGVVLKSLTGVFLPGSAAGYLINGNDAQLEPAWEIKNVLVVKF